MPDIENCRDNLPKWGYETGFCGPLQDFEFQLSISPCWCRSPITEIYKYSPSERVNALIERETIRVDGNNAYYTNGGSESPITSMFEIEISGWCWKEMAGNWSLDCGYNYGIRGRRLIILTDSCLHEFNLS